MIMWAFALYENMVLLSPNQACGMLMSWQTDYRLWDFTNAAERTQRGADKRRR